MNYPRIRELRLMHNLKQEFVAEQLRISQPEYSRLENGLREPRVEDFQCLSKLYGVKPSTFIPDPNSNEPFFSEDGKPNRSGLHHSSAPIWVNILEQHQELMNNLVESQLRSEQLFDKLIKLLIEK